MPRYWLEYTRVGHSQPTRRPVDRPRAEAVAYFEGFRDGSSSAERKGLRLMCGRTGALIAGAPMAYLVRRSVSSELTLALETESENKG